MIPVRSVNLPKSVSGETLEEACIKAAGELGYRAKSQDKYKEGYKFDPLHLQRNYDETSIRVGNLFLALRVCGIRKGQQQTYFFVSRGFPDGYASEKMVIDYLKAVSKHLPA